jgi:hypothetical protein
VTVIVDDQLQRGVEGGDHWVKPEFTELLAGLEEGGADDVIFLPLPVELVRMVGVIVYIWPALLRRNLDLMVILVLLVLLRPEVRQAHQSLGKDYNTKM